MRRLFYVLNVVGEVLGVSERAVESLDNERSGAVVLEADEETSDTSSRQIAALRLNEQNVRLGERRRC